MRKHNNLISHFTSLLPNMNLSETEMEILAQYLDEHRTTKLIHDGGDFLSMDLVECCKVGPITTENYCPLCGKKIIRNVE